MNQTAVALDRRGIDLLRLIGHWTMVNVFHRSLRMIPYPFVVLAVFSFLAAPIANAHLFDTVKVHIRGLGNTGTFTISDLFGCSALITATVADSNIATISPTGPIDAISLKFTVTAGTMRSGTTTILVRWAGETAPEPPCNEIGAQTINVIVQDVALAGGNSEYSGLFSDPVNTFTGELFLEEKEDLNLGGPMPLFFRRYYASMLKEDGNISGTLGDNWLHNFDWRLNNHTLIAEVITDTGRVIRFTRNSVNDAWSPAEPEDVPFQLIDSGGNFIFSDPSLNRVFSFNNAGLLIRIEDGKGNQFTLSYSNGLLNQVSDGLGRVFVFTYTNGSLSSLSDQRGGTVLFAYSGNLLTEVTDAANNGTIYAYAPGGLTSIRRPNGNTPLTQSYDGSGRVVVQADALGNQYTFSYQSGMTTVTDPLGNVEIHRSDAQGRLTGVTDQQGRTVGISYDNSGRRNQLQSRNGESLTFDFHPASGRMSTITDPSGNVESYTYTSRFFTGVTLFDLTSIVYPDGSNELFAYDPNGNLTTATDKLRRTANFTYNGNGQIATATNFEGGQTTLLFNADGTVSSLKDASGNSTSFTYDPKGRLSRLTRPDGAEVSYTYDAMNRLTMVNDERSNDTQYIYDKNGNVLTHIDAAGASTSFTYDAMDRIASVANPLGDVTTNTYDALGLLKTTTNPDSNATNFSYDSRRRLKTVTDGDLNTWTRTTNDEGVVTSATTPLTNTTNYVPNDVGLITQITDPLSKLWTRTFDSMNRATAITDPNGKNNTLSYDARGLITGSSVSGITAGFERNGLGQITQVIDPNGNGWLYGRDSHGRLISKTDPVGNTISYVFNSRNRPSDVIFPSGLGTLNMTYDGKGNITSSNYSDGTNLAFVYDPRNFLTHSSSLTLGYDLAGQITNSNGIGIIRDVAGRISQILLDANRILTSTYNGRGLLDGVTDWLGGTVSFVYDSDARLTAITRPNGVTTSYSYDAAGRVLGIVEGQLGSIAITRDGVGQITTTAKNVPSMPVISDHSLLYTYNAASEVAAFTYDPLGRVTADGIRTYQWDLASRLTSYVENNETITFTYDALNNSVSETKAGNTTNYVINYAFDLPSIMIVRNNSGNDIRYFVYTPQGYLLYSIESDTNVRRYYHFDEMGNTMFLTDDAGAVIASYAYEPYGSILAEAGNIDNPFTWQGKYGVMQEGTSGLYNMRVRYYDSRASRFLSRDTRWSLHPFTANPYQYALGNPLRYSDPLGAEFEVFGPHRGYNCHGYTFKKGKREFDYEEDNDIEDVLSSDYDQVPNGEAQPGDVIGYDDAGHPSHTGIVIGFDTDGTPMIISKGSAVASLRVHRADRYGDDGDVDWFIYRRKGVRLSLTMKSELTRLYEEMIATCDEEKKRINALAIGNILQSLNYQADGATGN